MAGEYKHVVLVGIDGAGNFYRKTDAPAIRRLFAEGAGTDYCLTSIPTISAECWGSMLIGVYPETHGLTNDIVSRLPYTDAEHPTVFRMIRDARPDAEIGAFSNWSPILSGIVERDAGVHLDTGEDPGITRRVCEYIREKKPTFVFVQFDSIDGAGHTFGYGSEKYLKELTVADGYVGAIRSAVEEAGIADDTLFIATADHGGFGQNHGGVTDEEKYVFFAAVGKTVAPGTRIDLEVKDIPAVVTRALGVPGSPSWDSKLPDGLFTK
ncbi:MAG: alkaline phosphatase family protein [Clostridia bacterium]|nr:alkaline phosphatase family protein [Clostridia bacterium]